MCGIAGWICPASMDRGEDDLLRMTRAVAHRGPDAEEHFLRNFSSWQVAMGHRRLAIIDMDPAANQPMTSSDGRYTIIFNGEIYNYIELRDELSECGWLFKTRSDTEVLLYAYSQWGQSMFDRLNGMYAFAIWDDHREEMILGRDPFGKKPMYIFERGGTLAFASEVEALLGLPWVESCIDRDSISELLMMRYVPGPNTMFRSIKKLDPGSVLFWSKGATRRYRFYIPPDGRSKTANISFQEAESRFLALLENSVRIRMRSDAPFGAFLSGGLDSSAIVALMARESSGPISTFSVGYSEQEYSELEYARRIAVAFCTNHSEVLVSGEDLIKNLPILTRHRGAPISETADIPIYMMSKLASESVKMVLTGEGADEVLAGYPKHRAEAVGNLFRALVPRFLRDNALGPLLKRIPVDSGRKATFVRAAGEDNFKVRMTYWFGAMSAAERERLAPSLDYRRQECSGFPYGAEPGQSPLRRVLFFDQTSWLPDNLLERGDRMMMAASIEGRMPFLDKDLVSFVSTIPDRYRLGFRRGKKVLRSAMKGVLPKEVLYRPKVGFKVPVAEWFRTTLLDYVGHHLLSTESMVRRYLSGSELDRIVREHVTGVHNHEKVIWSLLTLDVFHKEFGLDFE